MANQQARQDDSRFPAILAHSSVTDPSETRRVLATSGALHVTESNLTNAFDGITTAIKTIDSAHHEIHNGDHYKAGFQDTSMATNETITLLFVTPASVEWAHWILTAQATGAVVIELYEGATATGGTPVTRFNRNRNSLNDSTTLVYHTPSVTADGTKIVERWVGNEGFKESVGGEMRGDSEFILKQDTKYLIRLTAVNNGIKGAIGGDWYENTNVT